MHYLYTFQYNTYHDYCNTGHLLPPLQAKAFVEDPSAFMVVMPEVKKAEESVEEAAPEKPPESEDESDEDMGFGLFD